MHTVIHIFIDDRRPTTDDCQLPTQRKVMHLYRLLFEKAVIVLLPFLGNYRYPCRITHTHACTLAATPYHTVTMFNLTTNKTPRTVHLRYDYAPARQLRTKHKEANAKQKPNTPHCYAMPCHAMPSFPVCIRAYNLAFFKIRRSVLFQRTNARTHDIVRSEPRTDSLYKHDTKCHVMSCSVWYWNGFCNQQQY